MNGFVKSAVIPFVISLIIFSLIAVFAFPPVIALIFDRDKRDTGESGEEIADDDISSRSSLKSSASGTLTLVLICTDQASASDETPDATVPVGDTDPTKAEYENLKNTNKVKLTAEVKFITALTFDSLQSKVNITVFPPETVVAFRGMNIPINDMLYYNQQEMYGTDTSFLADYVTSVIGYQVDNYAYIDIDDYVKFADDHPGITVPLQESATVPGSAGHSTRVYTPGNITVKSGDLLNLIRYDGFQNITTKNEILKSFSLSALDLITTTAYYADYDRAFDKCVSRFYQSDIDKEAFRAKLPLFFSYKFYTVGSPDVIGDIYYTGGTRYFLPDKKATSELFRK